MKFGLQMVPKALLWIVGANEYTYKGSLEAGSSFKELKYWLSWPQDFTSLRKRKEKMKKKNARIKYRREYKLVSPIPITGPMMQYRGYCLLEEVGSVDVLGSTTLWWGDGGLFIIKFPFV